MALSKTQRQLPVREYPLVPFRATLSKNNRDKSFKISVAGACAKFLMDLLSIHGPGVFTDSAALSIDNAWHNTRPTMVMLKRNYTSFSSFISLINQYSLDFIISFKDNFDSWQLLPQDEILTNGWFNWFNSWFRIFMLLSLLCFLMCGLTNVIDCFRIPYSWTRTGGCLLANVRSSSPVTWKAPF